MSVTDVHVEKETLAVEINIPGHEERTTTPLFTRTKKALIAREGGRCFICGKTAEEAGHPLESHHVIIERSLANMIDFDRVRRDAQAGLFGPLVAAFNWAAFDPADPMAFVDDQTVNGLLLCKPHHTGKDEGIHTMPFPLWIAQRYAKEGYQFSDVEVIHHSEADHS